MIVPSRWMAGGRGLDDFRARMIKDKRIRRLVDYAQMESLFPGVDFEGGVCYFLWDRDNPGACLNTFHQGNDSVGPALRDLAEFDVFVRDERALGVLRRVLKKGAASVLDLVSGDTPFGLATNFNKYRKSGRKTGDLKLHMKQGGKRVELWVANSEVNKNRKLINKWKVLVPTAYGERGAIPALVLGPTLIAGPGSVCSQTYLCIGPFDTKGQAESFASYTATRFFRFLVSLRKISQHALRSTYTWVPMQSWDRQWTDAALYKKYGVTAEEQAYVEAMVREMAE